MKKKVLSITLVLALVAIAVVSATLAYFTDTEEATNTFTIGNVDIALIEQQRNEAGDGFEDFVNDKVLMPIVGSAQAEKDALGMPVAENYVDKIVSVENTGASDAWVRVIVAFPVGMDADSASDMPLHWNQGNNVINADMDKVAGEYNWTVAATGEVATIDGIDYNLYTFTYNEVVEAGKFAPACLCGFYLDSRVDYDENGYYIMINGQRVEVSGIDAEGKVNLPVFAQAVQAAGFDTADAAFTEAGFTTNPWA